DLLPLLLHGGDEDLVAPQEGHHGFLVLGHALSRDHLPIPGLALPDESRHGLLLAQSHSVTATLANHRCPGRAVGRPPACGVERPAPRLIMSCSSSGMEPT